MNNLSGVAKVFGTSLSMPDEAGMLASFLKSSVQFFDHRRGLWFWNWPKCHSLGGCC